MHNPAIENWEPIVIKEIHKNLGQIEDSIVNLGMCLMIAKKRFSDDEELVSWVRARYSYKLSKRFIMKLIGVYYYHSWSYLGTLFSNGYRDEIDKFIKKVVYGFQGEMA